MISSKQTNINRMKGIKSLATKNSTAPLRLTVVVKIMISKSAQLGDNSLTMRIETRTSRRSSKAKGKQKLTNRSLPHLM